MTRHDPGRSARGIRSALTLALVGVLLAGSAAEAQTDFMPYFGKNRVKYDNFNWHIYTTEHFEIFYYPEMEEHLARVASYAESAYQQVSADLKHDLAFVVPLIVFKTHSEFEQQNVIPGQSPEGVLAFAEPYRDRIVLPIDEPPDMLYRLITHELTHIFEFDIIPRSLIRRSVPLWVDEGLSDYMAGIWRPLDLMSVRDVTIADIIPSMTEFEAYGGFTNPRVVYNLGHAVFEFIESRWGKEGIRTFLFALRKDVIGGGGDVYEEAFQLEAEEFDQEFKNYLEDRFKVFRDRERPTDYGRDLAPNPERTKYTVVISIEASPSGDLIAGVAGNRKDQELDIVLISAQDGEVIRNLTDGFDKDRGFEYIAQTGKLNTVPWISWSPVGDRIAYFARKGKYKSLVIQNVVTGDTEQIIDMNTVDEPESPAFSPDGGTVAFSALQNGVGDIYAINLASGEITNLTNDEFADYAPDYSPDGSSLAYLARVSGNDKLFTLDLAGGGKTQLTFGTHDEGGPQFVDDRTLVFPSTATDPNEPVDPEQARNGDIFNIWTLDVETGELRQYTDTATGNVNPIVLNDAEGTRIAFVTYFKAEYGIHTLRRGEPLYTAVTSDFGGPGPIIDFQAPLTHTLVRDNAREKGTFEKLFLEGRPPINFGVTNNGDVLGGTQVTFTDVLGDQQFSMFAMSIAQYRTLAFSYANLAGRFQYAVQGFSQDQFFYGLAPGAFFDPALLGLLDRDTALAVRTTRGGAIFGIYPFDLFRRVELSAGFFNYNERFDDPGVQQASDQYQQEQFGSQIFRNGSFLPLSISFIQETTVFREFGPVAGNTMRLSYEFAPPGGDLLLSRQTVDLDARYYLRLGENGLLALRGRGFKSWGDFPDFLFFGGNGDMRGYDYLEFIGHQAFFGNAELRFPLIEAMLTPIGVLGGIRGVLFFNFGAAGFNDTPFNVYTSTPETVRPVIGANFATGEPIFGDPVTVSGFRLVDGRASYGVGLETFALGFPVHFDWSWPTMFNKNWENVLFAAQGGSDAFRKTRFDVWIGYDF